MANEATIRSSLQLKKGNLDYQSRPTSFRVTQTGVGGPTPGQITATTSGVQVDLSELTTPGLARISNLDSADYITYGIWDGANYFPLGEVGPGESYVFKLARDLGEEYTTGTGTTGAAVNQLRVKSYTDDVEVLVEAFEK